MIDLAGELDIATAPMLRQAVVKAIGGHPRTIELDLAGLTFVDVIGLHAIVDVRDSAADVGATFRLRSVSELTGRVIRLAGFGELEDATEI